MKNKPKPTKHHTHVFHQVCKLIPVGLVGRLSEEHGVSRKCRRFSAWSHVVALLFSQLTHAVSLNDVCDVLRHRMPKLGAIRGAVAPSRNGFSHANRTRNSNMMEALFWQVLAGLQSQHPGFGPSRRYAKLPRKIKRLVHAVDSSTIALVANCMDWAKHRRRKAAAKLHLRLNLQTFLPGFAVIEEASHHDSRRMGALCAGVQAGEIVVFDKAYVHFGHLFELAQRGVFWITRAKDNMACKVVKRVRNKAEGILADEEIELTGVKSGSLYPKRMRRIRALVEVNGEPVEMVFITNNLEWTARNVCDLYAARWAIEVFFKQIKQTLKLSDFLGHSKHAIRWQIWAALLLYLLLRFQGWAAQWPHSFTRLFALVRGLLWERFHLSELRRHYGTANEPWRMRAQPEPEIEAVTSQAPSMLTLGLN